MRGFSFYDKEKNKNTLDTLANALNSRKQTNINTGSITAAPQQKDNSDAELVNGAFRFGKGLYNMYNKGKENGYFNFGNSGSGAGASSGLASNVGSSSSGLQGATSKFGNFGNFGGGSGGGAPWGAIAGFAKQGYNGLTGKDEVDYSDTEQTVAYPLQGAAMGSSFGPWGAAAGALYGLGYSFKDDIGLKDNDLLTDVFFPIGMGDEHQGLIRI